MQVEWGGACIALDCLLPNFLRCMIFFLLFKREIISKTCVKFLIHLSFTKSSKMCTFFNSHALYQIFRDIGNSFKLIKRKNCKKNNRNLYRHGHAEHSSGSYIHLIAYIFWDAWNFFKWVKREIIEEKT